MRKLSLALFAASMMIRPLLAAPATQVSELVPGQLNAAAFVNVRGIMNDYGMLFDGGPLAQQIEQLVAMGLPDPRKEIDQLAIGGTIENMSDDQFVVVSTGSLRIDAIVQMVAAQYNATVTEEAYRGVNLMSVQEENKPHAEAVLANLTESSAMGSFDRKGLHPFGRLVVDTAQGQNTSYGQKYGSTLGAGDYAVLSAEIPKELRKDLEKQGQIAFLSLVAHARAKLSKIDGNVRLVIDGVCVDMFDAETVKRALEKGRDMLIGQVSDPMFKEMLEKLQIVREEATARLVFELPESVLRDILEGFTGHSDRAE